MLILALSSTLTGKTLRMEILSAILLLSSYKHLPLLYLHDYQHHHHRYFFAYLPSQSTSLTSIIHNTVLYSVLQWIETRGQVDVEAAHRDVIVRNVPLCLCGDTFEEREREEVYDRCGLEKSCM